MVGSFWREGGGVLGGKSKVGGVWVLDLGVGWWIVEGRFDLFGVWYYLICWLGIGFVGGFGV